MPRPLKVRSGLLVPNLCFEALPGTIEVPMFPSYFSAFSPIPWQRNLLIRQFFPMMPLKEKFSTSSKTIFHKYSLVPS